MREIKFRGRTATGEWVYGVPVQSNYGIAMVEQIAHVDGFEYNVREFTVDLTTVGQFTGLLDKNGREIWEGDVITLHYFYDAYAENLGVYEAEKEIKGQISIAPMGVWIECSNEDDSGYLLLFDGVHEESFEIIGDIFNNPELIA